jgi:hypothetical protein
MSVRAYRLIRMETEREATFNLWRDTEFMHLLGRQVLYQLDETGTGLISLDLHSLQTALKVAKQEETRVILRRMIAHATADGSVEYWCG